MKFTFSNKFFRKITIEAPQMKQILYIYLLFCLNASFSCAQDVVPKAKTKAEKKAEKKKMSLEERIESTLPVDVKLPSASLNLPGDNKISNLEDARKFVSETIPAVNSKIKSNTKKAKKELAKAKAKIFDGKNYEKIPIEKHYFKRGTGPRMVYIEFYTLKNSAKPSPYNRNLWWFDLKNKKIVEALSKDITTNKLLHGPYFEYYGDVLVKEGAFYMGAKHGRWEEYDRDFILTDKIYYHKGVYEESKITYYDADSLKIKEIMPMYYGKVTGDYFHFHEDGTLAIEGQYDNAVKVGKWIEYFEGGNRRKKETQHGTDCYDKTEAFVLREYDAKGKLLYEDKSIKKN
jgi:antitoxin component YwqK of YwqJK toxin-antitoxin module